MKKVLFPRANAVRSLGWLGVGVGASLSFDGLPVTIVAPLSLHPPTNQTNVSQSVVREKGGRGKQEGFSQCTMSFSF